MDCRICYTADAEATERTLDLTERDGGVRRVTLHLCDSCTSELLVRDWIDQPRVAAGDD